MLLSTVLKNPVSGDVLKLTITDKDTSEPVVASVTIGEETKDSGIDGVVQFTRAYGDYEATVSADGYATVTEELQFRSNHKNFEIELEAASSTGTVTVTCQDESENKLGGVSIAICTELPPSQSTIVATGETDGTIDVGVATITDVPYGSYKLLAHDPNTELSYTGDLTVDGDEEVTITLTSE